MFKAPMLYHREAMYFKEFDYLPIHDDYYECHPFCSLFSCRKETSFQVLCLFTCIFWGTVIIWVNCFSNTCKKLGWLFHFVRQKVVLI